MMRQSTIRQSKIQRFGELAFQDGIITWDAAGSRKTGGSFRRRELDAVQALRCSERRCQRPRSANDNDVVDDETGFTSDHQTHGNAFRFVMVTAMQHVSDSHSRTEA